MLGRYCESGNFTGDEETKISRRGPGWIVAIRTDSDGGQGAQELFHDFVTKEEAIAFFTRKFSEMLEELS